MDHRTASDPFHDGGQFSLGLLGHFAGGVHDGPQAEVQTMHRVQVPLDGAPGQPGLFPEGGNQADQVDPQTLLAQRHALLSRWRNAAALAPSTGAGDIDVLGYLRRNPGQLDDFPSALGPATGPTGSRSRDTPPGRAPPAGWASCGCGQSPGDAPCVAAWAGPICPRLWASGRASVLSLWTWPHLPTERSVSPASR